MANVKISELTAITSSSELANADIVPIVDSSDSSTKRVALSVLDDFWSGGSSVWCTGTNTAYLLTDCIGIGTATPGTDIMLRVQGDACVTGDIKIGGDVCIGGDDLFMNTNTSGFMLIADGTNFNPVAMSGDVAIDNAGATTIQATSVENSMLAGSIANAKLSNSSISYGGISLSLGGSDATPAFNLCDATGYKTTNLAGTITNAQLAGSIANAKLANDSVSYGGVSVDLGSTDATPAFNLCDATAYKGDSALVTVGTISSGTWNGTAIGNSYLTNSSVSYGGISVALGATDATPAFNLCDATGYPTSSLVGTITNAQLAGSIANAKLTNDSVSYGGVSVDLGATDATPAFNLCDATAYKGDSALVTVGTVTSGAWQGTAVATAYIAGTICDKTLASPVLCGTITGNAFLDEDNMASDSASKVASQQSIKAYVDSVASGLDLKCSSHAATTANLSAAYDNGSSGVGATLTNNSTQAALSIDGQTMVADERALIKDQSSGAQNGIYTVTTVGDGSTNWVLTRATDFDTSTEITSGSFTFVETGSSYADSGWVMTTDGTVTVGTTSLAWSQFSGAGQITAGDGMTKSGNTLNVGAGSNLLVNADAVAMCAIVTGLTTVCATNFAGTLATAAQANVTSLGTLTALTVDSICLNGATIGHTSDTDLITLADGAVTIAGDLTISGDDLVMGTNTSGYLLVADGTNFNPVAVSGDITIDSSGAVTIAATSVENSMLAGSIANAKLANSSVSYGGISLSLGGTDATPAFNLCDATGFKTTNLSGTITNDQLAGSIANSKLSNSSVSYGGISLALGGTDATPAFNLCDATAYKTTNLAGTITNDQLAGSIANAKLANDSVSYGGISVDLGTADATPAFNLCDATAYKGDSALVTVGTITAGTWNGTAIANANLANSSVSYGGISLSLGGTDATPAFNLCDATAYKGDSALVTSGALNSGSITSGFGTIDTGSSTITTTGALASGNLAVTGTITGSAVLSIDDTTDSTSTTTGSIHTDGGLGVVKDAYFGDDVNINGAIATTGNNVTNAANVGKLSFEGSNVVQLGAWGTDTSTAGILKFFTKSSDSSINNEAMVIDGSGNVGIGTGAPASILHINSALTLGVHASTNGKINTPESMYFNIDSDGTQTDTEFVWGKDRTADTGGTELMRLTETGILGIGVSPTGWKTTVFIGAQIGGNAAIVASPTAGVSNSFHILNNANLDTDNSYEYISSDEASDYYQQHGMHVFRYAAAGTAGNDITFSEAMRINASGDVGIGTTTPNEAGFGSGVRVLSIEGDTTDDFGAIELISPNLTAANRLGEIRFINMDGTAGQVAQAGIRGFRDGADDATAMSFFTEATGASITEKMRIDSTGYVGIGTATPGHPLHVYATANVTLQMNHNAHATSSGASTWLQQTRAANSSYQFLYASSGGTGDAEFNLRGDGNAYADGTWNDNGADYAEYFESTSGTALDHGKTVVLEGCQIRYYDATAGDTTEDIIGVVRPAGWSKNSMIIGNTAWNMHQDKYLTDDWGVYYLTDVAVKSWTDSETNREYAVYENPGSAVDIDPDHNWDTAPANATITCQAERTLNPNYDESCTYTPREDRPEWNIVGLLGQIQIATGQTARSNWIKMCDISSDVQLWLVR